MKHTTQNMSRQERLALKDLQNNKDLIIRKEDKGGTVILLDGGLYKNLNLNMLADEKVYRKLDSNPTDVFQKKLRCLLNDAVLMRVFDQKKQRSYLLPILYHKK